MVELEQKCQMINIFSKIKDVVNEQGGNIADYTPLSEYPEHIRISGGSKKYGADIGGFLGDISSQGMLRLSIEEVNLDFRGVKSIGALVLKDRFSRINVKSVDFSDLERLHTPSALEGAFYQCNLEYVSFPKLKEISGAWALKGAFGHNLYLKSISFPVLENLDSTTNQFDDMLDGVTGCTVHFPAHMESVISVLDSAGNGFSGTNTLILFDL